VTGSAAGAKAKVVLGAGGELSIHVPKYGLGPRDLLFTSPRGGAVRRSTFSEAWISAAGPLGIPVGDGYHQLRHFYASVLIRASESVKVVQERLGHTSAQLTLDIYSHLWREDEDRTRAAVDSVLLTPRSDTALTSEHGQSR
jgi:integrase